MLHKSMMLSLIMAISFINLTANLDVDRLGFVHDETRQELFSKEGVLRVHVQKGDIIVKPSDIHELKVIVHKWGETQKAIDSIDVNFNITSEKAEIIAKHKDKQANAWITLTIEVPRNSKLSKIVTHNGNVTISDMTNKVWTKSFAGNIDLVNIGGPVKKAKTRCGAINISMCVGSVSNIKTRNLLGDITIKNAGGKVRAHSKAGNVSLAMSSDRELQKMYRPTDIDVATKKGNIDLSLSLHDRGMFTFETSKDNFVSTDGHSIFDDGIFIHGDDILIEDGDDYIPMSDTARRVKNKNVVVGGYNLFYLIKIFKETGDAEWGSITAKAQHGNIYVSVQEEIVKINCENR